MRNLGLILFQPATLDDWMSFTLFRQRLASACFAVLAALALLLAAMGPFGAVSYSIGERKKELGIRVALGATPRDLLVFVAGLSARPWTRADPLGGIRRA